MFKIIAIIVLILAPIIVKASDHSFFSFKGTWYVYGFALYQPLDRISINEKKKQVIHKSCFNAGGGIGKDHFRIEYSEYLDSPRFLVALDLFPNSLGSPYIGYTYGKGLKAVSKDSRTMKEVITRGDVVIGLSFQPIIFFSVYTEYLARDCFFFAGFRFKLPYTIN